MGDWSRNLDDEYREDYNNCFDVGDITNYQAIQDMSKEELGLFLTDMEHYTDANYEWQSKLTPLLPFEDWEDWLNRRAIYGKG